jgi:hypothetical protein
MSTGGPGVTRRSGHFLARVSEKGVETRAVRSVGKQIYCLVISAKSVLSVTLSHSLICRVICSTLVRALRSASGPGKLLTVGCAHGDGGKNARTGSLTEQPTVRARIPASLDVVGVRLGRSDNMACWNVDHMCFETDCCLVSSPLNQPQNQNRNRKDAEQNTEQEQCRQELAHPVESGGRKS